MRNGILYRVKRDHRINRKIFQFVLPEFLKRQILHGIDFWTAETGDKKTTDVLIVTDHFSKLALAFPYRNKSAKQVARCLWDKFFCIYGFPNQPIYSDQGANFESRLIKDLLEMADVHISHTTVSQKDSTVQVIVRHVA